MHIDPNKLPRYVQELIAGVDPAVPQVTRPAPVELLLRYPTAF